MKKNLLIAIALLFGCTVFAQNSVDYPQYPCVKYKCEQMNPDFGNPPPWTVLNPAVMPTDCFPPSCYGLKKNYIPTPPAYGPNSPKVKYHPEMMKPDYPGYPPTSHVLKPPIRFD